MKKKHLKSVILLSKIATNFSIPGRQQQPKFQILFHENSSPRDLFTMNLDVYLATSSHKNKNLKH